MVNMKLELEQLTPAPKEGPKPENTAVLRLNRASGPEAIPLALCDAVASYLQVPLDHDDLRDQISSFLQQQQRLNLVNMGQLLSSLDLSVPLSDIPIAQLERVPTPAVIEHEGCLALVDGGQEFFLGIDHQQGGLMSLDQHGSPVMWAWQKLKVLCH